MPARAHSQAIAMASARYRVLGARERVTSDPEVIHAPSQANA
jgi:hypothetical protein